MVHSDGANLAGKLTWATPPMGQWLLVPGSYELVYRGTDPTGTSHATVEWRDTEDQTTLGPNDIARVVVETQQPLAFDAYDQNRATGAFVLADAATNHTVAAGMIRAVPDPG